MTTVLLHPSELRAGIELLAQQALRVAEAGGAVYGSRGYAMPPAIAAAVAAELEAITVEVLRASVVWLDQAIDTQRRLGHVLTDQSVAAALSTPPPGTLGGWTPSPLVEVDSFGAIGSPVLVGGTSTASFLANNPLLAAAEHLRERNPAAAAQLSGLHSSLGSRNEHVGSLWNNSRPGATFIGGGLYQGIDGRIGSHIYRRPGALEFEVY